MKTRNHTLDFAIGELEAGGAGSFAIEHGRHAKVRWTAFGVERTTIVPMSPSDNRAQWNLRSFIRRQLRDAAAEGARTALVSAQAAHVHARALQVRAPDESCGEGKGRERKWKGKDSASRIGKELDSLVGSRR